MNKTFWIAAGGTAGHINSALVIGEELEKNGFNILYFTGKRPIDYKLYENKNVQHLDSQPLLGRTFPTLIKNLFLNFSVFIKVFFYALKNKPHGIIGCGGFICGPTILAAKLNGSKTFILEQNSVMGFTNKILSLIVDKIFISITPTIGLFKLCQKKIVLTGNPVRKEIEYSAPRKITEPIRILVFGGSLGAEEINELIKKLIENFAEKKLEIIHQCGNAKTTEMKALPNIIYQQFEYLDKIYDHYKWCDVIIARSGASTVSELVIINKPSYLIPALYHRDRHQVYNAQFLQNKNPNTVIHFNYKSLEEFILNASQFKEQENKYTTNERAEELIIKTILL